MSGGKGGSQTTEVKIPAWLEAAGKKNLARADEIAKIGYAPYFGPDVAGLTGMQQAAMQNTNDAASAFGLSAPSSATAGMPQAQTFAGGVQGYSSAPMYQQSLDALRAANPAQYAAMTTMFSNPQTGAQPRTPFGEAATAGGATAPRNPLTLFHGGGGGGGGGGGYTPTAGSGGGYTGFYDMINGGGAGASGSTFQGGPMSGTLNTIGVRPAGSGGSSSGMGSGK